MRESHMTEPDPQMKQLRNQTIEGMAHWAGSGPAGTKCGECQHWKIPPAVESSYRTHRCAKFKALMRRWGSRTIGAGTPSCRYFEANNKSADEKKEAVES